MTYPRRKPRSYELLDEFHLAVYGDEKTKRLKELAESANSNHHRVEEHWKGFLDSARQAGIALLHAYAILGRGGKWRRWRSENFVESKEKCNQYIRVAKHWNDPRIVQARQECTINSVEGFLKVIRNSRQKDPKEQSDRDWFCQKLKKMFSHTVRKLSPVEI